MMLRRLGTLALLSALVPGFSFMNDPPVRRVACLVRESGDGLVRSGAGTFPRELGRLLGPGYEVRRYRLGAYAGKRPFRESPPDQQWTSVPPGWLPDIVLVDPGIVDSTLDGAPPGTFTADSLSNLVAEFRGVRSNPRVMLLLPPAPPPGTPASDSLRVLVSLPRIRSVAFAAGTEVVDLYSLFLARGGGAVAQDLNSPGAAGVIAARLHELIRAGQANGVDIAARAGLTGSESDYYGYRCLEFRFEGREAKIVRPKRIAPGCPWIWRARFWGHEPQTEIALLERGFHVAYCDVAELFGNEEALAVWDRFYDTLTRGGLARKAVLEGFSRGGFYVYRWALHRPSAVACVYADAPVLDMKSWPGGKGKGGGNPVEWQRFKDDFHLASEEDALRFRGNPLDLAPEIARGGYPMLHVCGLADVVVPFEENTAPFEKRIAGSGGRISVIRKPGIGHHPHSLPNPQPIVDFILSAIIGDPSR